MMFPLDRAGNALEFKAFAVDSKCSLPDTDIFCVDGGLSEGLPAYPIGQPLFHRWPLMKHPPA